MFLLFVNIFWFEMSTSKNASGYENFKNNNNNNWVSKRLMDKFVISNKQNTAQI